MDTEHARLPSESSPDFYARTAANWREVAAVAERVGLYEIALDAVLRAERCERRAAALAEHHETAEAAQA